MKRGRLWLGLGIACSIVGGLAYWSSIPRIGSATSAEVLALIPRELREEPPRDLAGEARFRAARNLITDADYESLSPRTVRRLAALVASGPWRSPPGPKEDHEGPAFYLQEPLAHLITEAARRGDAKACAAAARFALGFVLRYDHAQGDGADALEVGETVTALAEGVEKAARLHGFREADRKSLLALVPSSKVDKPAADSVCRDFRLYTLPRLLRVAHGPKELQEMVDEVAESDGAPLPKTDPGTFDPLETTRLMVRLAQEDRAACFGRRNEAFRSSVRALRDGLPTEPPAASGTIRAFLYRCAANHGRNTIGRSWALPDTPDFGEEFRERRAKGWRRIRIALSAP